ncbi:MAG: sulfotransferase [Bacteroidales bacterium]|nr:sulfotransferase [Bacteroidales bacterium]
MEQKQQQLSLAQKRSLPMFFIIARPRSGTTMLRTLFDRHPNVVIPLESPFMLRYYWKYRNVKVWTREKILDFYNDIADENEPEYLNIRKWTVDLQQLREDLLALEGNTSYTELCKVVNASYESLFPKQEIKLVGDKNPVYSNRAEYLLKMFPDAKFIHMVRDYRDYLQSMLRAGFVKGITPIIAHRWRKSLKLNFKLQRKYPDQFYFVRYEDFVEEPEKYFQKMCDFLEIPYEEQIFDFHNYKEKFLEHYGVEDLELYHSKLFRPISNKNVGDWREQLNKEQVIVAEAVTGKTAEKAGYPRAYKKIPVSIRLKVQPIRIYLFATKMVGETMRKLPHNMKLQKFMERGPMLGKKYWELVKTKK